MLNPHDFKRAIQAIDVLGATPAILAKVGALAGDPNTNLETMCALMKHDGSLCADIIRISNSPYHAPDVLHGNLTSAVNSIGLREVIRVVNLSLARQLFARDLPSYGVTAEDYWSGSIAAALVMEAVARELGLNPDDAYTVGILHAVGRVLINRVIEEQRFTIYWDGRQTIQDWERSTVGFDYAEAGALLLEHWHFPPTTCGIIRSQLVHCDALAQRSLLGSIQFTRRLLQLTGAAFENEKWTFPDTDPFVQASALTPERLSQILSDCRQSFQRIAQSVDVN